MTRSRRLVLALVAIVGLLGVIQLVPYGRNHSNPPDVNVVKWDSPTTEKLASRACFDCHSNQTKWPWYASIAPVSWRIQNHVTEGRDAINFTAFDPAIEEVAEAAGEAGETVTKGEMPPKDYLLAHPEARLAAAEKRALVAGLDATFAAFGEKGEGGSGAEGQTRGNATEDEKDERGEDRD